jgi:5-hydroxyisourate hydrolase
MSAITTHVLDTSLGTPAAGVAVFLEHRSRASDDPRQIGRGATDADGRLKTLAPEGPLSPGIYQLRFETGAYFKDRGIEPFYPNVVIAWNVRSGGEHYHIPLLLSPFGYSTYRGS